MQAFQIDASGTAEIREVPKPEPAAGEKLLKVTYCALCAADAKIVASGHPALTLPRIPGHEVCAVDEATGREYVIWPGKVCGRCEYCRGGRENLCRSMRITGFHRDGGLAEYITAPETSLVPLSDSIPVRLACLAEPAACAVNAVAKAGMKYGDKVLIFGAGPLGLMLAMEAGADAQVFIREINPDKIAACEKFCRQCGFEIAAEFPPQEFHVAINAASDAETLTTGLRQLKPGGRNDLFQRTDGRRTVAVRVVE